MSFCVKLFRSGSACIIIINRSLTGIQRVTGPVLSADLSHTVFGLHVGQETVELKQVDISLTCIAFLLHAVSLFALQTSNHFSLCTNVTRR